MHTPSRNNVPIGHGHTYIHPMYRHTHGWTHRPTHRHTHTHTDIHTHTQIWMHTQTHTHTDMDAHTDTHTHTHTHTHTVTHTHTQTHTHTHTDTDIHTDTSVSVFHNFQPVVVHDISSTRVRGGHPQTTNPGEPRGQSHKQIISQFLSNHMGE